MNPQQQPQQPWQPPQSPAPPPTPPPTQPQAGPAYPSPNTPVQPQPQPQPGMAPPAQSYQGYNQSDTAVQTDYSIDYLNQISAPVKQTKGPSRFILIIAGVIGVGLLSLLALMMIGNQPTSLDRTTEIYIRMDTLRTIARENHANLRNNDLRATNTSFQLFLTNAIRDIEEPLEAAGVTKPTIDKRLIDQEQQIADEYKEKFEDARLNVMLDNTYAREMTYQLNILATMLETTYDQTDNETLRERIAAAYDNLEPIAESFSNFTTTAKNHSLTSS